jgi:hypothetical protein
MSQSIQWISIAFFALLSHVGALEHFENFCGHGEKRPFKVPETGVNSQEQD